MTEKPKKFFVGIPKNIFPKSPKRFFLETSEKFLREIQKDFSKRFFGNNKKNFQDNSRIKYIKQTNKDKVRTYLEKQAHFPQENPSFLMVLKKTILDYFLPFPPEPPLDDKRKCLVEK